MQANDNYPSAPTSTSLSSSSSSSSSSSLLPSSSSVPLSDQDIIEKIESLIQTIVESFVTTNDYTIHTPRGNIRFTALNSTITFARLMSALNTVHYLLTQKKHIRKRDLYYSDVELFKSAANSAVTLDTLSSVLQVPRNRLNILAADRGIVYGNLKYQDHGGLVDCMLYGRGGKSIPPIMDNIEGFTSDARFILVIEKESTLMRLSDDGFCEKYGPCVIITAKGYPDLGTRMFTKRLKEELSVPLFYLGDWDPFGVEIMLTYRVGSKKGIREFEHNLFLPSMIWLGIHAEDLSQLPPSCLLSLSEADVKKANHLMEHPAVIAQPQWKKELEFMLTKNIKAEIQSLSHHSLSYLSDSKIEGLMQKQR